MRPMPKSARVMATPAGDAGQHGKSLGSSRTGSQPCRLPTVAGHTDADYDRRTESPSAAARGGLQEAARAVDLLNRKQPLRDARAAADVGRLVGCHRHGLARRLMTRTASHPRSLSPSTACGRSDPTRDRRAGPAVDHAAADRSEADCHAAIGRWLPSAAAGNPPFVLTRRAPNSRNAAAPAACGDDCGIIVRRAGRLARNQRRPSRRVHDLAHAPGAARSAAFLRSRGGEAGLMMLLSQPDADSVYYDDPAAPTRRRQVAAKPVGCATAVHRATATVMVPVRRERACERSLDTSDHRLDLGEQCRGLHRETISGSWSAPSATCRLSRLSSARGRRSESPRSRQHGLDAALGDLESSRVAWPPDPTGPVRSREDGRNQRHGETRRETRPSYVPAVG
jgi:hypothetical protein